MKTSEVVMKDRAQQDALILYSDSPVAACKLSVNSSGANFLEKWPHFGPLEAISRRGYVGSARASYGLSKVDPEERP